MSSAAGAASGLLLTRYAGFADAAAAESASKLNVLLFITDQDRAIQHFPRGWVRQNLPGYSRLIRNGLSFTRAFTNACMCSPARSTLFSGYFPAQHGVKYTLEEEMTDPVKNPQVELPVGLKNAASVMSAAGYNVVYKGKWHCSKPAGSEFTPADLENYGFERWNPPDAGANQDVSQAGGGSTNNDGRYMDHFGDAASGDEGVLQYLGSVAATQQPFFLVVSLVNPHDVLFYPRTYRQGDTGYDRSWLQGPIGLPATVNESLRTKPRVQREFRRIFNLSGYPRTPREKRNYLNFYGNLIRSSDSYLVQILDVLTANGLLDNTLLIKTADHGEMGLAHGGLRQKNFNFYEESLRVPLVYSNPVLFPRPRATKALVSHVDFLPTLASIAGAPAAARADWQGVDYSHLLDNPARASGSTMSSSPTTTSSPGRRRAPTRSRPTTWSASASDAGSCQVLRPQGEGAPRVGDVRPEERSAGTQEPGSSPLQTNRRAAAPVRAAEAKAGQGGADAAASTELSVNSR